MKRDAMCFIVAAMGCNVVIQGMICFKGIFDNIIFKN